MLSPDANIAFTQAKQEFIDGLAAYQAGHFSMAERCFLASIALVPGRVSTLVNLAATRVQLGQAEAALATADEVLALEPGNVEAWLHRGAALGLLGRHEEALACHQQVLARHATLPAAWLRQGQTLERLNRPQEALVSYERALALDVTLAAAWSQRGGILRDMKRLDEAAHAFRQALAHGADAELHGYYLASVTADAVLTTSAATPATAPRAYVELLFDDYAHEFEAHVVQVLGYQAHGLLAQQLEGVGPARFQSALDLGCGTGLCGPLLRPRAERLVGVDLSSQMLSKARALGAYDALLHADIVDHLRATEERHDLVVAADVFIYVGDLAPVFEAVKRVLVPGGVFGFSAEQASAGCDGFELLPSLRYAHAQRYLRQLAAQHGFEVVKLLQAPIRKDQQSAIDGLFVCLTLR